VTPATEAGQREHERLQALGDEFFQALHASDPFNATVLGVTGFDDQVPDVSREGTDAAARAIGEIERSAARLDASVLGEADTVDRDVLVALAGAARTDLEHASWAANASADGYGSPQGRAFLAIPAAPLADAASVDRYLTRLGALGGLFDALGRQYVDAATEGRRPTRVGVRQAVEQLRNHLAPAADGGIFQRPVLPAGVDEVRTRARIDAVVTDVVAPAMRRLAALLSDELAPVARGDDEVGLCHVPGGSTAYLAAVRRHTTTDLTPLEVHDLGHAVLDELREEWLELGSRVLGTHDVPSTLRRLREDATLRFASSADIVAVVTDALARAEQARDRWFPHYDIPECTIEEIDPAEAGNAALAHYRPPSADGSRPGAHCVLTVEPGQRFRYEYEALAFHESTPGHHLQIASAQTLRHLPQYRRFLDAEVCAYVEGWGLYSERLADEMGLYSSELDRLGMLSFDALRACRLVVDTGMHSLGWSRDRAVDFMWANTATTRHNVVNEVNRYIAWPGQALAYMVGRREIVRLRALAQTRLGDAFDVRAFHGAVLSNGAVPLSVLERVVLRWVDTAGPSLAIP
jgi:uncharacterized protein (DUF885 family)